ncbi:hypothetical protein LSH36_243g03039 [Paralvinella palmiformis]|uniref:Uncharacterized protein n=1 Tax=Paralvinella palmiformis TaxID=53620 RepID=A0AAD9JLJ0_9ANNE|nr:hypothetical protein LSH36_243g03039 [Paralvinella palmiformis]
MRANGASNDPAIVRDTILAQSPIPTLSRPRPRTRKTESATILTSSAFKRQLESGQ